MLKTTTSSHSDNPMRDPGIAASNVDDLTNKLETIEQELKRWGYELVNPPFIERTLGNIDRKLEASSQEYHRYVLLQHKAFRLSWLVRYNSLRIPKRITKSININKKGDG